MSTGIHGFPNSWPENFRPEEFACNCCGFLNISMATVLALQKLRTKLNAALIITSGCRCERHNALVSTAQNKLLSKHLATPTQVSCAVDVTSTIHTPLGIAVKAEEIPEFREGGIGTYSEKGFVHLDTRGYNSRWHG